MYNEIPLIIPEDGFLNSNNNKEGLSSIKKKKNEEKKRIMKDRVYKILDFL